MAPKKIWHLTLDLHTGNPGRPAKIQDSFTSKAAARNYLAAIVRAWGGNGLRNITLTNVREN
jgi:hypothetical protein